MLLEWWDATHRSEFVGAAMALAAKPPGGFNGWSDGETLIDLVRDLKDRSVNELPERDAFCALLEEGLISTA